MTQNERHEQILRRLAITRQVLVKDLAREFEVTEDCIRKDLTALEKQGQLRRIHGGAVSVRSNFHIMKARDRVIENVEEKTAMARKALSLLEPGSLVFLGISSTTLQLARLMIRENIDVTVVTNMTQILDLFAADENRQVLFIGGQLNKGRDGFVGGLAQRQIREFNFAVSFMGAVGVNLDKDAVMTYNVEDGLTKKAVMESSRRTVLFAESSKFNQDGAFIFAHVSDFDVLITGDSSTQRQAAAELTEVL